MKPKLSRPGPCSFLAFSLALALLAVPTFAQLVSDSATNTLNNVTNNLGAPLTVGTNGPNTRLNLVNGTVVTDTTAVIGQNAASTNNVVSAMGANTVWSNSTSLDVRRGSISFEGGTIFGGSLLLTNSSGFFLFDQGTLVTTSASISNGQAFVVGANAATPSAVFRDTNAIVIPISVTSYVAALTYPAVMNVSNLVGSITKVTVTLSNFTHAMERDVHVLLVGPDGQKVILMANAGGTNTTSPDLIFDDAGAGLPLTPLVDGTYRPTDYAGAGNELSPAPARPYGTNLSAFIGGDANGQWQLYVTDTNGPANAGGISNGWALNFTMTQQAAVWDVRSNATATTVATNLVIGSNASSARLFITNGASLLVAGSSTLGATAGSASNIATIAGPGSLWATSNDLNIGSLGTRNQLIVSNGGRVSALNGIIGTTATGDSNSASVNGAGSLWTNGTLTVGSFGSVNSLVVSNGGRADGATLVRLGQNAGSIFNTINVSGAGSLLRSGGNLLVGEFGAGNTLLVTNGGAVSAGATAATGLIIGANAGAAGNQLVLGGAASSITVTNAATNAALDVRRGNAIFNGGTINADRLLLTNLAGGVTFNGGTLITRVGTIANGTDFIVGENVGGGSATWDVRSNATATTIAGGGNNLIIGNNVANSALLMTNGALMTVAGGVILGNAAGGASNSALISGSRLGVGGQLTVGSASPGNQFVVAGGARVTNVSDSVLGQFAGADSNMIVVTGSNSVWTYGGNLYLGQGATVGNQVTVSNGGGVLGGGLAIVGYGGPSNLLTVTGTNSFFTTGSDLYVGDFAGDNLLTVSTGAVVTAASTYLGFQSGSSGNTALISGTGAFLTNTGLLSVGTLEGTNRLMVTGGGRVGVAADLEVGKDTAGNQLFVTNGGLLEITGVASLGLNPSGASNVALISGTGSVWTVQNTLTIGGDGPGNRLTVSNGGALLVTGVSALGQASSGTNTAVVTGPGSVWSNGASLLIGNSVGANLLSISATGLVSVALDFQLGNFSGTNSLLVTNGGVLQVAGSSYIGTNLNGIGNVALVSGSNSVWTNGQNFYLGQSGQANRLTVSNAGRLFTGALADIGSEVAGNNNNAMVTGSNSLWLVAGDLNVGNGGANNQLTVSNAGTVVVTNVSTIGANANGNRVVVTGTNSLWSNAVGLVVGNVGANNQLAISNGGVVFSALGQLGIAGNNNLAIVTSNSVWNSPTLQIGVGSTGNQLVVSNGGLVNSSFGQIGIAGNNNLAIVTGGGSVWNSTTLEVGVGSTGNQLFLTNGGGALSTDGYIGSSNGGNTATTTIFGAGSYWSNANSLTIGNLGTLSRLVLVNGGTAFASNSVLLGASVTSGRVIVQGGTLRAANSATNAIYEVRGGTNQSDSGLVDVDFLLLTNVGGQFTLNGGTLITRGALLSNGSPFAVGAGLATGTNPVTFVNTNAIVLDDQTNLATPYPSTIVASNLVGRTAKITVTISNFTAGLPSDVDILLRAPTGQGVVLMSDAGTNLSVTNITLTFDAAAATAVPDATNLTNGTFRPADYPPLATFPAPAPGGTFTTNLAFFNGLDPNGTWSLFVIHGDTNFTGGISNGWSISIITSNLPAATWDVRSNVASVVAGDLYVGSNAPAATLLVTNGGKLLVAGGSTLGQSATSGTNVALIAGSNSSWASGSNLVVGNVGALNQLTVSNGAVVANVAGVVGATATSASNRVVVTGTNSLWTNSGTLALGSLSAANSLVVSNGGVVVALGGATFGAGGTASNNSAVVTGTGSALNAGPFLNIGDNGSGNSLAITNGGAVTASNQLLVGVAGLSNLLNVGGGSLTVTNAATNGLLEVRRGSAVFNGGLVTADQLVLTNPGSLLTFNGGTLVTRSAIVSNGAPLVIGASGTNPAVWDVRAGPTNSLVVGDLYVGSNSSGNSLLVTNSALLTNTGAGLLGYAPAANSNIVRLAGAGSLWLVGRDVSGNSLYVGSNGAFNQLIVSNGATLTTSSNSVIGVNPAGTNNLIAVTGAGSVWSNGGNLSIGSAGSRNSLVISNGGAVYNSGGFLGVLSASSNNTAVITDAGSVWTNSNLLVGVAGSFNTLTVTNGALLMSPGADVGGNSTATANRVVVTGTNSVWSNYTAILNVGNAGSSNLLIVSNGGSLSATTTIVGNSSTATNNAAIVTGAGALWSNSLSLIVGNSGVGSSAVITNGGAASAATSVLVGAAAGSSNNLLTVGGGTLTVTNGGVNGLLDVRRGGVAFNGGLITADQLVLSNGTGTFTFNGGSLITRGGVLTNGAGFVIGGPGTTAAVWDLRSGGSNTLVSGNIFIGSNSSLASLLVTNGALLTNSGAALLGFGAGANSNSALIAGAGSRWFSGQDATSKGIYVGSNGAFNSLVVSNGANLISAGTATVGLNVSASNNLALVTGAGSVWSNPGTLFIGNAASRNTLVVSNGGRAFHGSVALGVATFSSNNVAIVTDAGSVWSNTTLIVGSGGLFNTLRVSNGATVLSQIAEVGSGSVANGNLASVSDAGSAWTNTTALNVGSAGSSNTLILTNGGALSAGALVIGDVSTATNNLAVVTGGGSSLSSLGGITVGNSGVGSTLVVTNSGSASAGSGLVVGANAASSNNLLTVGNGTVRVTNSSATAALDVRRGSAVLNGGLVSADQLVLTNGAGTFALNGGTLVVRGGVLSNGTGFVVGGPGGIPATWDVRAGGSNTLTGGNIFVGSNVSFATLLVTNGAVLSNSGAAYVGFAAGANSNSAVLSGAGSRWLVGVDAAGGGLYVGSNGAFNSLALGAGARLTNQGHGQVGFGAAASNNSVTVGGAGAGWFNTAQLVIGGSGSGNTLTVSTGGNVFNTFGTLGSAVGSSNNFAVVSGAGSLWSNSSSLFVGSNGFGNQLTISAGGAIYSSFGSLGSSPGSSNNSALITGPGSVWSNTGPFSLGGGGAFNTLTLTNGGLLVSPGADVGSGSGAAANLAVVNGVGSLWSNVGTLNVGNIGSRNQVVVTNGGRVFTTTGVLGNNALSTNNTVTVTGAGSVWTNSLSLLVGNSGTNNTLLITNGGAVAAATNVVLGALTGSATNLVALGGGGTLSVVNALTNGLLDVRRGSVVLNGGTVNADQLVVTNGGASLFTLNAGTVNVSATTFTNGQTFLVGNGVSNAAYHLVNSNTHSFGNGLVVNTNATLFGNGIIVGNVTNRGSIAPGNSPGSLTINGSLSFATNAGITFEIGGLIPTNQYDQVTVTNFVQFAGTLSLALINGFTPGSSDTFTLMKFGSASGTFANATNNAVLTVTSTQFKVTYSATNLVLSVVSGVDSDGDGQSDSAEALAGTSSTNSADYLHVITISRALSGAITVQFASVSGKTYVVEYSNDLVTWPQAVGATFTNPSAGILQWIDDGTLTGGIPTSKRFYRIRLVVP